MTKAAFFLLVVTIFFTSSCESVHYVKSELTGTAKPPGGTQEVIPVTRNYKVSPGVVRKAVLEVLDEQGYLYEENPSTNTIKTEPKLIGDQNKFGFIGAQYYAKLFIKLDESRVSYHSKFNKKSNLTMAEENLDFPDKEAELRKNFFALVDKKLGS